MRRLASERRVLASTRSSVAIIGVNRMSICRVAVSCWKRRGIWGEFMVISERRWMGAESSEFTLEDGVQPASVKPKNGTVTAATR